LTATAWRLYGQERTSRPNRSRLIDASHARELLDYTVDQAGFSRMGQRAGMSPELDLSSVHGRASSVRLSGQAVLVSLSMDRARRALSSVESAALSGLAAAVLSSLAIYLLGRQPGVSSSADDLNWYADSGNRFTVFLGLNLAALAVVAFSVVHGRYPAPPG
jgi:hypothetical protein